MTRPIHGLPAGTGPAAHGSVDAAVLRSAVELRHEIAVGDLALDAAMLRIAERTRELTGASAAHVTMLDGSELVTGASTGRNLGLEVVAEGVETEAVWDTLSSLGCTVARGYYLSRPVPPDALRAWLETRRAADAPSPR
jgi:EAL domain-containing protein